jgi:hypothetical protein
MAGEADPGADAASVVTGTAAAQVTRTRMPGFTAVRLDAAAGSTRIVRSPGP